MTKLDIYNPFNAPVYHVKTVTSTMNVSRELLSKGKPHGTVITADFQQAGRGRIKDRKWEMEKELNLPFTVLLCYPQIEDLPCALTLRTGLSVALAIEDFVPSLQGKVFVKWPNDIIINEKKTAGILCEAEQGNVHLGIGINVAQKEFPEHLQKKATSLALAANNKNLTANRYFLLEKILIRLYSELETETGENWKDRLEERLYKKGKIISFMEGIADSDREVTGRIVGIGNTGELLIVSHGETEARSYFTGELKISSDLC
jgi:BirA family biotin operon repressor/biotin-[acetyl-CoA-carboxylase] ligase